MEKRQTPRMKLEMQEGRHAGVEVLDLSSTGARIRTSRAYVPGKVINFNLSLFDAGEEIPFLARVRWTKPEDKTFLVGIEFINEKAGHRSLPF